MSDNDDPGGSSASAGRRVAGLIAANATLVVGVLAYMGWAYDTAFLGYFQLNPLDLGVGVSEFILHSLALFSPTLIVVAVLVIAAIAVRPWEAAAAWTGKRARELAPSAASQAANPASPGPAGRLKARAASLLRSAWGRLPADEDTRRAAARRLVIGAGLAVTAIALLLKWAAGYIPVNTYLVLVLLAAGPLMLTQPARDSARGRFPYSLAVVVAAVCALWATSLYAEGTGTRNAQAVVRDLQFRTAVALYSTQRLGLSGPGVTVRQLPPGAQYGYEYEGLRLLLTRSGTYYLLPVGWYPGLNDTFIIDDSDTIRIVLYSGVVRPGG